MTGGDVVAIIEAELFASLSEREIRRVFGVPDSWPVTERMRRRVVKVKAPKVYAAMIGAFNEAVMHGGGLRLEKFGWIATERTARMREIFQNYDTGEQIFDGDGMYKRFNPLPDGYYCRGFEISANNPLQVEIWHAMVASGWFVPWWGVGFSQYDGLMYGPVKYDDLTRKTEGWWQLSAPYPTVQNGAVVGSQDVIWDAFPLQARKNYGTWERFDYAYLGVDGHERWPMVEQIEEASWATAVFKPSDDLMAYLNDWETGGEPVA